MNRTAPIWGFHEPKRTEAFLYKPNNKYKYFLLKFNHGKIYYWISKQIKKLSSFMSGISENLLRVDMKVVLMGASKEHPNYILILIFFILT